MFQEYFKCRHISHKSECPQVVVDKIVQLKVRENFSELKTIRYILPGVKTTFISFAENDV
jgi:hypothetical protein